MLGDDLRVWFELFNGLVVYRPRPEGGHVADGWVNWKDIEGRFSRDKLLFAGRVYDSSDKAQRDQLLNAIVAYATAFVDIKLLERRRQLSPISLDYRLTPFGRRIGNWGDNQKPGFRKRAFFFLAGMWFKVLRYKGIITVGASCWAVVNAFRFYGAAATWVESLPFMAWSALAVAFVLAVWAGVKSRMSG